MAKGRFMKKELSITSLILCGFMAAASAQEDPFRLPQRGHVAGFQESHRAGRLRAGNLVGL